MLLFEGWWGRFCFKLIVLILLVDIGLDWLVLYLLLQPQVSPKISLFDTGKWITLIFFVVSHLLQNLLHIKMGSFPSAICSIRFCRDMIKSEADQDSSIACLNELICKKSRSEKNVKVIAPAWPRFSWGVCPWLERPWWENWQGSVQGRILPGQADYRDGFHDRHLSVDCCPFGFLEVKDCWL